MRRRIKYRWAIEMREKEGFVLTELSEYQDVVLDGYCNSIETLSHSFVCKPIYLRLFRRHYKRSNFDEHFNNEYDVSLKGVRIVPEMGFFLKRNRLSISRLIFWSLRGCLPLNGNAG